MESAVVQCSWVGDVHGLPELPSSGSHNISIKSMVSIKVCS